MRLPYPSLVVVVGPSAAGKSTWVAANFRPDQIVSSDALRSLVGEGEHDLRASSDAFAVLDMILERRLKRRLVTVVDTLGLDSERRARYRQLAARHQVACHAVVFDTAGALCRARNKARDRPVPAKVLAGQLAAMHQMGATLEAEGFDAVHQPEPVDIVPAHLWSAPVFAAGQIQDPVAMRFGLQIPTFTWAGGPESLADRLGAIGPAAEQAGFSSLWLMDHFIQIPQVGPEWNDMLDSYTALGFLAGRTSRIRLGALVTGVTYRNLAHLAKIIATLDVLSGGRAICGLGAAWFEREHRLYGWDFPPVGVRYQLLEDALQLLPLMWGPGSPSFSGRTIDVAEAICYPRPRQEHIPVLIGGSGERRTLRLVARYADACNLFGDPATVAAKVAVLAGHCRDEGRPIEAIKVTHLTTALVGTDYAELNQAVERLRPRATSPEAFASGVNAGTVEDHIGWFRRLADAGVQTAIISLPDLGPEAVERFARVIAAFPPPGARAGAPVAAPARDDGW